MNSDVHAHRVPSTPGPFLVDGFRHARAHPGTRSYFLSHYHGDHYSGLQPSFAAGTIYCSPVTAALLINIHNVQPQYVKAHAVGERFEVEGVNVTFVDANHCPGAVLLVFEPRDGTTWLHCGDMRYSPEMQKDATLTRLGGCIDAVFLDTTYCNAKRDFPPQEESITAVIEEVRRRLNEGSAPSSCLFLVGAYTIGKERLLLRLARELSLRIYVDERKMSILRHVGLASEDMALFTSDVHATPLHVCKMSLLGEMWPFFRPNFVQVQKYREALREEHGLDYAEACAFIPTGWAAVSTYNVKNSRQTKGALTVQLAPYSEHSSFGELMEFVRFLKPKRVIPTVYSDGKDAARMVKAFAGRGLLDEVATRRDFISKFCTRTSPHSTKKKAATDGAAAEITEASETSEARASTGTASTAAWDGAVREWEALGSTASCDTAVIDLASEACRPASADGGSATVTRPGLKEAQAGSGPPPGCDAAVWWALPPELRRELLSDSERARGRPPTSTLTDPARKPSEASVVALAHGNKKRKSTITSFFRPA